MVDGAGPARATTTRSSPPPARTDPSRRRARIDRHLRDRARLERCASLDAAAGRSRAQGSRRGSTSGGGGIFGLSASPVREARHPGDRDRMPGLTLEELDAAFARELSRPAGLPPPETPRRAEGQIRSFDSQGGIPMAGTVVTGNVSTEEVAARTSARSTWTSASRCSSPDETQFTTMTSRLARASPSARRSTGWRRSTSRASSPPLSAATQRRDRARLWPRARARSSSRTTCSATCARARAPRHRRRDRHARRSPAASARRGGRRDQRGRRVPGRRRRAAAGLGLPRPPLPRAGAGLQLHADHRARPGRSRGRRPRSSCTAGASRRRRRVRKARRAQAQDREATGFWGMRSFAAAVAAGERAAGHGRWAERVHHHDRYDVTRPGRSPRTSSTRSLIGRVRSTAPTDKVLFAVAVVVVGDVEVEPDRDGLAVRGPENGTVHGVKVDAFISGAYGYRDPGGREEGVGRVPDRQQGLRRLRASSST